MFERRNTTSADVAEGNRGVTGVIYATRTRRSRGDVEQNAFPLNRNDYDDADRVHGSF